MATTGGMTEKHWSWQNVCQTLFPRPSSTTESGDDNDERCSAPNSSFSPPPSFSDPTHLEIFPFENISGKKAGEGVGEQDKAGRYRPPSSLDLPLVDVYPIDESEEDNKRRKSMRFQSNTKDAIGTSDTTLNNTETNGSSTLFLSKTLCRSSPRLPIWRQETAGPPLNVSNSLGEEIPGEVLCSFPSDGFFPTSSRPSTDFSVHPRDEDGGLHSASTELSMSGTSLPTRSSPFPSPLRSTPALNKESEKKTEHEKEEEDQGEEQMGDRENLQSKPYPGTERIRRKSYSLPVILGPFPPPLSNSSSPSCLPSFKGDERRRSIEREASKTNKKNGPRRNSTHGRSNKAGNRNNKTTKEVGFASNAFHPTTTECRDPSTVLASPKEGRKEIHTGEGVEENTRRESRPSKPLLPRHEQKEGTIALKEEGEDTKDNSRSVTSPTSTWGRFRGLFASKERTGDMAMMQRNADFLERRRSEDPTEEVVAERDGEERLPEQERSESNNNTVEKKTESPSRMPVLSHINTRTLNTTPSFSSLPDNATHSSFAPQHWKAHSRRVLFSQPHPPMIRAGFASSFPEQRRDALLRVRREESGSGRGRRSVPENEKEGEEEEERKTRGKKKSQGWVAWWNHLFRVEEDWGIENDTSPTSTSSEDDRYASHSPDGVGRGDHVDAFHPSSRAYAAEIVERHDPIFGGAPSEAIDLVTVFHAYLDSYSEGMMNIVEASLLLRSQERQPLMTFEELQHASENPVLIRQMAMKGVLDIKDSRVQETVSNVVHTLIEESSGDLLNPMLKEFLEVFFAFPFISLTEAEYVVLTRSGIEFIALMNQYRHVLPKGKFCFSIRFNYSFFVFCVNVMFLLLGFILNCLVAIGIIMEIAFWMTISTESDSVTRGFYVCIAVGAGYILILMSVTVLLRPPLLSSASGIPSAQREPSLYFLVVPLIPLYDFMCLVSLLRIRKRKKWDLLALHNLFAISRIMMVFFCLFYSFPQVFLAGVLTNLGSWVEYGSFNLLLFPSQFLRSVVLIQFCVMTLRFLCSSLCYSSTHLFGFGWPGITEDRHGFVAHDGMTRVVLLLSGFVAEAHFCLFLFALLRTVNLSCWKLPAIIAVIAFFSCMVVVIVYGLLVRSVVRRVVGLLRCGIICAVVLTLTIIPLLVLLIFDVFHTEARIGEDEGSLAKDLCTIDIRTTLENEFSTGFAIQFTFLGIVLLYAISMLYLLLRYGFGLRFSSTLKEWLNSIAERWSSKRENHTSTGINGFSISTGNTDDKTHRSIFNESSSGAISDDSSSIHSMNT